MSIQYKTIKELSIMLKNNDISNKELISETYSLIKSNSHLNAFITLNEDDAIKKAEDLDKIILFHHLPGFPLVKKVLF